MKNQIFPFLIGLILCFPLQSQTFHGQIIELTKTKNEIKIPVFNYATIYVETETQEIDLKDGKVITPYQIAIEKNGSFETDISEFEGETLNLYFVADQDYSYVVLKNIPKSKLFEFINVMPVVKNVYKATCGHDCFTVDYKKTYRHNSIKVTVGDKQIEFKRKRNSFISNKREREIWFIDSEYYYEFTFE